MAIASILSLGIFLTSANANENQTTNSEFSAIVGLGSESTFTSYLRSSEDAWHEEGSGVTMSTNFPTDDENV